MRVRGPPSDCTILLTPCAVVSLWQPAALLIFDPEQEFSSREIAKLQRDVGETGLSLVVAAEWYDHDALRDLRFKDVFNRRWWRPITGGSNLPALNDLLAGFGVEFAAGAASGTTSLELDGERNWIELVHGVSWWDG